MSIEKYRKLVDEICVRMSIPNAESMYATANMQVKGVEFTMLHDAERAPAFATVYCDFGALPTESVETVLIRLLQTNMYLYTVNSPSFVCNAENNHILLAVNVPLASATADTIFIMMDSFADMALEWRQRYFLTPEEQSDGIGGNRQAAARSTLNRLAQFSRSSSTAGVNAQGALK